MKITGGQILTVGWMTKLFPCIANRDKNRKQNLLSGHASFYQTLILYSFFIKILNNMSIQKKFQNNFYKCHNIQVFDLILKTFV